MDRGSVVEGSLGDGFPTRMRRVDPTARFSARSRIPATLGFSCSRGTCPRIPRRGDIFVISVLDVGEIRLMRLRSCCSARMRPFDHDMDRRSEDPPKQVHHGKEQHNSKHEQEFLWTSELWTVYSGQCTVQLSSILGTLYTVNCTPYETTFAFLRFSFL